MKNIDDLIPDIHKQIRNEKGIWFTDELREMYADEVARNVQNKLNEDQRKPHLRLSGMGDQCPRKLWYSIHHPELATPLEPWAEIKFCFGHMLEALAITLAKAAGHTVTGEQDELRLDGIVGHRDCVIDGVTVDVKSASSISFTQKFKKRLLPQTDDFGYLDQLDGYVLAAHNDPLVLVKDRGCILAIDKQLGHMCLYKHEVTNERAARLKERIRTYKEIVSLRSPPRCTCGVVSDGEGGNLKLDLKASYSPYKYCCFPNLRTFFYAGGPRYLVKVVKRPMNKNGPITEVNKYGQVIY